MAISITTLSGGNTPADGSDPRTFPAIWNATASDLENEILPNGVSSPSDGEILAYDSGTSEWVNQALESAQLPAGSILQVVRATDTTERSTTSASFVDAGLSVTITPTLASSNLIFIWSGRAIVTRDITAEATILGQITDSSDVALSGAEEQTLAHKADGVNASDPGRANFAVIGFVSAGSTSSQTFKTRFRGTASSGTRYARLENADNTGQLYVIEVAV